MIHKYRQNEINIVLDVESGAIHVVDDIVYDILDYYENMPEDVLCGHLSGKYTLNALKEALNEVEELKRNGLLFSEFDYSSQISKGGNKPVVKALCLNVAHDCNLRCGYCFAGEGEYGGKRAMMSLKTGKKAVDFIIHNSGNRHNLEIDFFGGEPLMNFEVVEGIISYARDEERKHNKNFRFTITTNGLLLNDTNLAFINENMHNLVLSLDGRKEVNDVMRNTISGESCYEIILPKLIKAAESRYQADYYVRGTFTHHNLDFSKDVLHLANLGFKQISIEPVVAEDNKDYSIKEDDLPALYEQYEILAKEMALRYGKEDDFNFFHFMIDLEGGPCLAKRLTGCGAGTEYLAVTPEGDLYACHQFIGNENYKLGNVDLGITSDKTSDFKDLNVFTKEVCAACWAKYYCSGGCAANALNFNGDLKIPYEIGCDLQRKRTECAIALKCAVEF
ncbi:MAG: thioether cross-link-forming SCIFF peptide maturase [Defluviitaleaceae bacterium]|nr:thioether cross-link-forming SCIFF peptide maturase [Defluviitaleaceae bacterium]